jgi:hypothetical protein
MKMRVLLISVAGLLAVASYAWFHITYIMGVPVAWDMPFVLFHTLLPLMVLALLVGTIVLWANTKHVAALLQLVSCGITFLLLALEEAGKYLDHAEKPQLSEFMREPPLRLVMQIIVHLCFIAFLTGYIWYARIAKRI